jgi:GTP-binding protein EngB required for normal cell division
MKRTLQVRSDPVDGVPAWLHATLLRVDHLLDDAERLLAPSSANRLFPRSTPDATPLQAQVIGDDAEKARALLRDMLLRNNLAPADPATGAVAAARSALRAARVAAADLGRRQRLDALPPPLARDLSLTCGALTDLLEKMDAYLAQDAADRLARRSSHLSARGDGTHSLAEFERVVATHGLTHLRADLTAAAERMESPTLDVAVFGRIKAGKSSLLNHIIGQPLLPAGVTPVTAVPTRLVHGAKLEGTAWLADGTVETFDPGRIAEFASEHQNPGNSRRIARLQFALPSPLLQLATLIDTPGLGSPDPVAGSAAAAWLHRCDVGILLVDAASTLTLDDIASADALARAGAEVIVLLSKADLLPPEDAAVAMGHIERELFAAAGLVVAVHPVSVKASSADSLHHWVRTELEPLLRDHRRRKALSMARLYRRLRTAVIASLEHRLAAARNVPGAGDARHDEGRQTLRAALAELDRMRAERTVCFADPAGIAAEVIEEAAHNAAVIWREEFTPTFDATAILLASLNGRAAAATSMLRRDVGTARARLANALNWAARRQSTLVAAAADLQPPVAPPAFTPPASLGQLSMPRATFLPPVLPVIARYLQLHLKRLGLLQAMATALAQHDAQLQTWRAQALDDLRREFVAKAERIVAELDPQRSTIPASTESLMADLDRLRRAAAPAPTRQGDFMPLDKVPDVGSVENANGVLT